MTGFNLPAVIHPNTQALGKKPVARAEVDGAQPLARGLMYAFLWSDKKPLDSVTHSFVRLTSESYTTLVNKEGAYINHGGRIEASTDFSPFETIGTGDFTILSKFRQPSTARETLFCSRQANSASHIEIRLNSNAAGNAETGGVVFFAKDSSGSGVYIASAVTSDWQTIVCTRGGGVERVYLEGALVISSTRTAQNLTGSPTLAFGGLPGTATIAYQGDRSVDIAWDRALSDSELRSISQNPYQILKPSIPMFTFAPGEAEAPSAASLLLMNRASNFRVGL